MKKRLRKKFKLKEFSEYGTLIIVHNPHDELWIQGTGMREDGTDDFVWRLFDEVDKLGYAGATWAWDDMQDGEMGFIVYSCSHCGTRGSVYPKDIPLLLQWVQDQPEIQTISVRTVNLWEDEYVPRHKNAILKKS